MDSGGDTVYVKVIYYMYIIIYLIYFYRIMTFKLSAPVY